MSIVMVGNNAQGEIELINFTRGDTFTYKGDIFLVNSRVESLVNCVLLGGAESGEYRIFSEKTIVNEITVKISFEYV